MFRVKAADIYRVWPCYPACAGLEAPCTLTSDELCDMYIDVCTLRSVEYAWYGVHMSNPTAVSIGCS